MQSYQSHDNHRLALSPRQRACARRGQSLIVFFLMLIVMIGIMALTMDFGFVLLSRRQMQTAVNAAALEGARQGEQADDLDQDPDQDLGRRNAQRLIQNVFDDDLDPTENPTRLGAGPDQSLVRLTGTSDLGVDTYELGDGSGTANLLNTRPQYIYRPSPELNSDNEPHGDLVRGTYKRDDEETGLPIDHGETSDYSRDDFQVNNGPAFLARLRKTPLRSGIANSLDRQTDISSSGAGSPLLIGHLAWFSKSPPGTYDIRQDGVTVRATAIADMEPIAHVGSSTDDAVYQSIDYAVIDDAQLPGDPPQWYRITEPQFSIGQTATIVPENPVDEQDVPEGYVPILSEINGDFYVIGFRLVTDPTDEPRQKNASPRLQDAWHVLRELDADTRDAVLDEYREKRTRDDLSVERGPVLVRTIQ